MSKSDAKASAVFYVNKCSSHVRRVLASYYLAVRGAEQGRFAALAKEHPDLAGELTAKDADEKVLRIINESHLLLLKANFEIFMHRLTRLVWQRRLTNARDSGFVEVKPLVEPLSRVPKKTLLALLSGKAVSSGKPVIDEVLKAMIPEHGLEGYVTKLEEAGLNVTRIWNEGRLSHQRSRVRTRPQIAVAFQVRHLVEHENGRVDERFQAAVKHEWKHTTWRSRALTQGERVLVLDEDIRETADCMVRAAEALRKVAEAEDAKK